MSQILDLDQRDDFMAQICELVLSWPCPYCGATGLCKCVENMAADNGCLGEGSLSAAAAPLANEANHEDFTPETSQNTEFENLPGPTGQPNVVEAYSGDSEVGTPVYQVAQLSRGPISGDVASLA